MTNPDTNTLNGALEQLGITMADNLVTMGVSDADPSDGLTTLASKILEISPVPQSFDGISLTGDKNILSAADSEYVTLEAQLTDSGSAAAVSGETVTFTVYKSSDDSVVTTLTADTNSSGVATVSYYGEGAGDLYIKSNVDGIISSEIYVVDAIKYSADGTGLTGTYNTGSDGTYDYITRLQSILDPQTSLTNSCEVSYKFKVTSISGTGYGALLWMIGSDVNNGVLIGTEGNSNRMRIYSRSNGNNTAQQTSNNVYSLNTWFDVKMTYSNGVISITVGGQTASYSLSSVAYFKTYTSASYNVQLSQFIVKPL